MSQNKKRKPQSPQQSSKPATNSDEQKNEQQSTNDSEQETTETSTASVAGDAETPQEAPADGQDTPDTQEDPAGPENGTEGAPPEQNQGTPKADRNESSNAGKPVDDNTAKVAWVSSLPQEPAPEGRILEAGDDVAFDGTLDENTNMVTVNEDVYRKVFARGSNRPTYTLLYRKGTQVAQTAVQAQVKKQDSSGDE